MSSDEAAMSPSPQPLDPLRCALLLIDLQRDFLDPRGYAAQAGLDVERLRRVIGPALALRILSARSRAHRRPSFLTVRRYSWRALIVTLLKSLRSATA